MQHVSGVASQQHSIKASAQIALVYLQANIGDTLEKARNENAIILCTYFNIYFLQAILILSAQINSQLLYLFVGRENLIALLYCTPTRSN